MPWLVTTGPAALWATLFAIGFAIVSLAIGRRLMIVLGAAGGSGLERGAIALVLGAGTLQFVPFCLGIAGALTPRNIWLTSGAVAALAAFDVIAVVRRVRQGFASISRPPTWILVWLLALAPGLVLALLSAWTPTLDPDGLGYHLTVPKRWLTLGSLGYLPTYPYSNTPMGVEMLFTIGLCWAGDAGAKLVHFVLGVAAAVGLYGGARRLVGEVVAALGVSVLLYGPFGIGYLMGWAYVEAACAAALISSGVAWLIWYERREPGFLRVAGLLAGIGASFKMTAGLFPVALGVLTIALLWREARQQGRPGSSAIWPVLRLAPLLALPVLPWLVRSAVVTGNPVFPMFAHIIPSRDFSALQSKQFDQYNRYMVWGVGAGAHWGLGVRKAILASAAAVIAIVGAVIYRRQTSHTGRATALVVLGTTLVQLGAAGLYKRYWVPLLAVLELPLLALLLGFMTRAWLRPVVVGVTAVLSLLTTRQLLGSVNADVAGLVKTSLGLERQEAFLNRHVPLFPLYDKINRELSPAAGVMLAAYCSGFYIDRTTYCVDIVQDSLRVSSWPAFVSDLERLRVTHVLAPRAWEAPLPESSGPPRLGVGNTSLLIRTQEHAMVGRILREHSTLLAAADDQGLYEVDLYRLR